MTWADQLIRIRRLLRDPQGLIWSEPMLRRIFNDEQNDLFNLLGVSQSVEPIAIPPEFQHGYTFDWEWALSDHADGDVYLFTYFYADEPLTYTHVWEAEHLKGYDSGTDADGESYTHPWEAWWCVPGESPPIPLPADFHSMLALYWDRQSVDPISLPELLAQGITTWRTEKGVPVYYWRNAENDNWIHLYPLPEWVEPAEQAVSLAFGEYALTFGDDTLVFGEEGTGATGQVIEYDPYGLSIDGNLLCLYEQEAAEVETPSDESNLPAWMQKYIEYGVAARAFRANTDGQITSLADYWDIRKSASLEAIRRYKMLKLSDRKLCLRTSDKSSAGRVSRRPRLPSHYPAVD